MCEFLGGKANVRNESDCCNSFISSRPVDRLARLLRATMNVCCVSVSVVADLNLNARDASSFICQPQRGGEDNALDMVACS